MHKIQIFGFIVFMFVDIVRRKKNRFDALFVSNPLSGVPESWEMLPCFVLMSKSNLLCSLKNVNCHSYRYNVLFLIPRPFHGCIDS